ncbi:hypothetical protein [Pseudomonas phage vB_Pae_BR144a]|nr:hypothetical protein [Pseudomonas phage vB_Pae_BR144a]
MTTTATITAHGFTGFLGKGLSLRELQCVLGIAAGRTSKELARDLGMQPGTVGKRVLAATTKLGVTRRAALVAEAMRARSSAPCALASSPSWRQHNPSSMKTRPCGRAVAAKGRSKLV